MAASDDNDDELINDCGLDRDRDAARTRLMLELVRRVRRLHARRRKGDATPTAVEKQAQLEKATRALATIGAACAELSVVTSTWLEGGPRGSPAIARWPIARRIATHLSFPDPPSRFVRVWTRGGKRTDGTPFDDEAISIAGVPAEDGRVANPTRDTRELARGLEDLAFVWPEYLTKILGAIGDAAERTLEELKAEGQTVRSEASRDEVMRDLVLVFHAVHRRARHGAKASRMRFVHRTLGSLGEIMSEKAVANRIRDHVFRMSSEGTPEGLPEVPSPADLDAEAMLEALEKTPGSVSRVDALAPLDALLGPAAGILLIGQS